MHLHGEGLDGGKGATSENDGSDPLTHKVLHTVSRAEAPIAEDSLCSNHSKILQQEMLRNEEHWGKGETGGGGGVTKKFQQLTLF